MRTKRALRRLTTEQQAIIALLKKQLEDNKVRVHDARRGLESR